MVESEDQRHNRELIELLNELRVALPGVQVLFAFLLAVPFSNGYSKVTKFEKDTFFVSLIATAVSSALLIATPSIHRLRFRADDKERLLVVSNVLTIAGLFCLAVAITCAVFVITDFLFHHSWAAAFAAIVAAAFLLLWYGVPLGAAIRDFRRSPRVR